LHDSVRQYEGEIHFEQHTSSVECKFLTLARAVDLTWSLLIKSNSTLRIVSTRCRL